MRRDHRSTRHHLRLIQGEAQAVVPLVRPPSPSRLAANIVRAAQDWAAAALAGTVTFDLSTQEGQLLLALLDSVQDMEYHAAGMTVGTGQLTLNMEPGTPGA